MTDDRSPGAADDSSEDLRPDSEQTFSAACQVFAANRVFAAFCGGPVTRAFLHILPAAWCDDAHISDPTQPIWGELDD